MDLGLGEKTALVSGGASGIGLAVARGFLAEGARVAITSRRADALADAARRLAADGGADSILTIDCDVSTRAGAEQAVVRAIDEFGRLDCLVANAGASKYQTGWNVPEDDWLRALNDNLATASNLTAAATPRLIETKGSITAITSIAAIQSVPAPLPYSAAKAALQNMAKGLSDVLAGDGVRVNVVVPGNVLFDGGNWDRKLKDPELRSGIDAYIDGNVPLKRFGRPEEIADAVMFLASPRAGFITGATLVVDGGQVRAVS